MGYIGIHKKGELTLSELLKSVKERADFRKAGAIATFVGVVRGETLGGENVERLELEAYEERANKILGGICEELKKREGVVDVQIHHFVGEFGVGEDLVYVVVAGAHRENVFGVLQEAVERYKNEAPVFKKEHIVNKTGVKESYWVSEQEATEKHRKK
ncbi:MAG: molybdenum cofactor biosynthesis protein MoaE [Candidatus Bathyarchaeota archaeon]|nr:molybdenum cofactor biosynthesis protein MoaE [Candidatus Bathyarchaeota archaeon]